MAEEADAIVGRILKLAPQAGDVVVLRGIPLSLAAERSLAAWAASYAPDVLFLSLGAGECVECLDEARMAAHGWVRKG
jgi:hypothetical protein